MDPDRFLRELAARFDDFPRSELPRDVRFAEILDAVPGLARPSNLARPSCSTSTGRIEEPPTGGRACASSAGTRPLLGDRAERGDLALLGEPRERLGLDLADALARDPELAADLLERLRVLLAV